MTSFELYTKYRNSVAGNRGTVQRCNVYEVLEALWNETMNENIVFSNIEFISIVKKMIENANYYRNIDETKIFAFDAYFLIKALYICIQNKAFSCIEFADDYLMRLFKPNPFDDKRRIEYLTKTSSDIKKIEKAIETDVSCVRETHTQTKENQNDMDLSEGKNDMSAFSLSEYSSGNTLDIRKESGSNSLDNNSLGERVKKNKEKKDITDGVKKSADPTDLRLIVRSKDNKELIDKWHSEIDDIRSTLESIQPDVSKMLENIMGFSDKITEKYILQFARMQIELYNFISDNYMYHKGASEKSENQDYINAVSNYEEFMYSLADSLAVFGVEEIVSSQGDSFDGKIHNTAVNDFSSRNSVIKKSIRSGFRYKEIIIQKERVEI